MTRRDTFAMAASGVLFKPWKWFRRDPVFKFRTIWFPAPETWPLLAGMRVGDNCHTHTRTYKQPPTVFNRRDSVEGHVTLVAEPGRRFNTVHGCVVEINRREGYIVLEAR